jgi:hypothetical protein
MLKVQTLGSQKISNMLKIISIHMTNLLLLSPSKTIFWNLVHFSQYLTSKPCWKDLFSSLKFPVFTPFRSVLLYLPQCLIYYQYLFPKYSVSYMIYCNLSLKKLGFIYLFSSPWVRPVCYLLIVSQMIYYIFPCKQFEKFPATSNQGTTSVI